MTLIVEDGTGLADADAYHDADYLAAYATKRSITLASSDPDKIESAIREAAEYIDTVSRYKAQRLTAGQLREFPRTGLQDWSGYDVVGVPERVRLASAYLAVQSLAGVKLWQNQARGGQVTHKSIGPISTSWAPGASPHTLFSTAAMLLEQYTRDPKAPYIDASLPEVTRSFSIGMNDDYEV